MNVNNDVMADRTDKPLRRADILQRIQDIGGSNKLDVSSQNLHGIDLSGVQLNNAHLDRANLCGADLRGAKSEWSSPHQCGPE